MTPEGAVKLKVKRMLKDYGAHYFMPVQTGYGAPALDFIVCHRGKYLSIETKAPGKRMTPRQEAIAASINNAGGMVIMVDGDLTALENWLALC